eukprot:5963765-Prorocentrum_lima.AAC.1
MTSSLVGSEMCIRDRLAHSCGRARVACRRDDACRAQRSRVRRPRKAVSYTHLTLPTICSV